MNFKMAVVGPSKTVSKLDENTIRKAFIHLKMAEALFMDVSRFGRDSDDKKVQSKFKAYAEKLKFIETDFMTTALRDGEVRDQFRSEMSGDILFYEGITQKCLNMDDKKKAMMDKLADCLLDDEEIIWTEK